MVKEDINEKFEIKEFKFDIIGNSIIIENGENKVKRTFNLKNINLRKEGNSLIFESKKATKREKRMIKTIISHLNNIVNGFKEEFVYKLGIAYLHFPITVELDKNKKSLLIKNFLGEKKPRIAKIVQGATVEVDKNQIIVRSHDKEIAGQTAANIEHATKIRNRDRRKFQDGIFLTEKNGRLI
ncbi:MAG TPA: 50S ribosomal protein L6 [Candidatus Paceibacterota bacterium]|nr:50S ribosomal protein L6 [Candidatus Paceibacterota bacterium]